MAARIRVTILGIKSEMMDGGGIEIRNDHPIADYQFMCEPNETLRSVFKRYGYTKIGKSGTFLRLYGSHIVTLDYIPTDGDRIEQFVPYLF